MGQKRRVHVFTTLSSPNQCYNFRDVASNEAEEAFASSLFGKDQG